MLRMSAILMCCTLAGCQLVPGEGPLTKNINKDAGQSAADLGRRNTAVFDIVDVDSRSARLVSDYASNAFNKKFGIGGGSGSVAIGVGDELKVTIFEAGADGLFSTKDSKSTTLDIVVQPNGTAAIPYVGTVNFRGMSLEQARQAIKKALSNKAVEPDVIVSSVGTASRTVSVSGAVAKSAIIPLNLNGEKVTDAIAQAGGAVGQPYDSYVTLVRGGRTGTALLKSVIEHPSENVYVRPGDQIFVARDPRTFTLLGATKANSRIEFGANDLNLLEAVALGGGGNDYATDAKGYFLLRYEEADIVQSLLGPQRFHELLAKGMAPNSDGRYPLVYRFDMTHPDSLLVGQTFPIKSRDVIYVSRHPAVDFSKFLTIIGAPLGIASQGASTISIVK